MRSNEVTLQAMSDEDIRGVISVRLPITSFLKLAQRAKEEKTKKSRLASQLLVEALERGGKKR